MKKLSFILIAAVAMFIGIIAGVNETTAADCAAPGYVSSEWHAAPDCWSNPYRSTCWAPWQRIPLRDQGADVNENMYRRSSAMTACGATTSHARASYNAPAIGYDHDCGSGQCGRITPYAPFTVNGTDGTTIQRFCYPKPMCQNQIPYENFRAQGPQQTYQVPRQVSRCNTLHNYMRSFKSYSFSDVYQPVLSMTIKEFLECVKGSYVPPAAEPTGYTFCPTQTSITRAGYAQIQKEGVISPQALFRLVG